MNSNSLHHLVKICWKRPRDRSTDEIDLLYTLTKHNKIFSSLTASQGPSLHKNCCKYLKYEYCKADHYLFHYGNEGDKFYIILTGVIGVEIPTHFNSFIEVIELHEGDCFGELALESDKPRQASIRCKVDCHFIYLSKGDYKDCLGKFVKDRRTSIVDFLHSLPLFRDMTKGTLTKISYSLKEKHIKKGEILFKEGDHSDDFYIVKDGEVGLYKKLTEVVEKTRPRTLKKTFEVNVANRGRGEIFGEEDLIIEEKRNTTCKCVSNVGIVYVVNKAEFIRVVNSEEFWEKLKERIMLRNHDLAGRVRMISSIKGAVPSSHGLNHAEGKSLRSSRSISDVNDLKDNEKSRISHSVRAVAKHLTMATAILPQSSTPLARSSTQITMDPHKKLLIDTYRLPGLSTRLNPLSIQEEEENIGKSHRRLEQKMTLPSVSRLSLKRETEPLTMESQLTNRTDNIYSTFQTTSLGCTPIHMKELQTLRKQTNRKKAYASDKGSIFDTKDPKGLTIYSMNSWPVYSALWSPL